MSVSIAQTLWNARIPLVIRHSSCPAATPFITSLPRFSYLALLLPRLAAYFKAPCSSFHHEEVQLRNLAAGLLLDLYQPTLPWQLTVGDEPGWDIGDTFLNCVKEADFVRNGNANQIMKMSKEHTTQLWHSVVDNNYASFCSVNSRLLDAPNALKNVPLRIYIPSTPNPSENESPAVAGSFRVLQTLVSPTDAVEQRPKLLGEALRHLMPGLFPSSRAPALVHVVSHGAAVPLEAPLEELMKEAAYPDGWVCLVVAVR